jgi:hypothetical protein
MAVGGNGERLNISPPVFAAQKFWRRPAATLLGICQTEQRTVWRLYLYFGK